MSKDNIQGGLITREQAYEGLGDPATWEADAKKLQEEFKAKPSEKYKNLPKLIYLASPYSSKAEQVVDRLLEQHSRYNEALRITAKLMNAGNYIYSPIVHCHPMAVKFGLPTDWQYWKTYCELVVPRCDEFWIATMIDWDQSTGVLAEKKLAEEEGIPIYYLDPETCGIIV